MPNSILCACTEVDVRSGRIWITLFATGLSTETLRFTSSEIQVSISPIVNLLQWHSDNFVLVLLVNLLQYSHVTRHTHYQVLLWHVETYNTPVLQAQWHCDQWSKCMYVVGIRKNKPFDGIRTSTGCFRT